MTILERVALSAAKRAYGQFRPATAEEFFALRLAVKLGDIRSARHYADLAERFSQAQLLKAYARALPSDTGAARRFHLELESLEGEAAGHYVPRPLVTIRIERRAVGLAMLREDHLVHADARQLSSTHNRALDNAVSFITRFLERFRVESVALETVPKGREVKRGVLNQAVLELLKAHGMGIIQVAKSEFLAAFGHPAPRFRIQVRDVISGIYPVLSQQPGGPWTDDAAALGLYVQTERLLNSINQSFS